MKKFISILLAAVMMFSLAVTGFATEETIELDTEYTFTVARGKKVNYSFIAPEDDVYSVEIKLLSRNDDENVGLDVNNSDKNCLCFTYVGYSEDNEDDSVLENCGFFVAGKNEKCNIVVYYRGSYNVSEASEISFTVKKCDSLTELKIGQSYIAGGDNEHYVIRPTEDAVFDIWSYFRKSVAVRGTDGSYESTKHSREPLDFPFKVKAGEVYLVIVCNAVYTDEPTPPIVFNVADGTTILPDVIEIEEISMSKGSTESYEVSVLPYGSVYSYDNLILELSDDSIADVYYSKNSGKITVKAKKYGETTLKITEPISGTTVETTITVVSLFRQWFKLLFLLNLVILENIMRDIIYPLS